MLLMGEQVFLLIGEVWLVHNGDIQCTVEGRGGRRAERIFFMFKFFLSCHEIRILFHMWNESELLETDCR